MRLLFLILFSFIHADPSCASINAEIIGAKDDTLSVRFTIENTDRKKTLVLPGYSLVNNTLISPDWEIRIIRDGVCVHTFHNFWQKKLVFTTQTENQAWRNT